jgi:hypothetical protein
MTVHQALGGTANPSADFRVWRVADLESNHHGWVAVLAPEAETSPTTPPTSGRTLGPSRPEAIQRAAINSATAAFPDAWRGYVSLILQFDDLESWLHSVGERLDPDVRERILDLCESLEVSGHAGSLEDVRITPIYDGELQLEWNYDDSYIEVEARSDGRLRVYGDIVGIKEKIETRSMPFAAGIIASLLDSAALYIV